MYKEIIVSVVVVISIIIINFVLQNYTKNSITTLTSELEGLKQDLKEGDKEKIERETDKIKGTWQEIHDKLAMYIEHDELEKVKTDLVALEGCIEVEDYDTSLNELNKCVYVLEHIKQKHEFSLINIF